MRHILFPLTASAALLLSGCGSGSSTAPESSHAQTEAVTSAVTDTVTETVTDPAAESTKPKQTDAASEADPQADPAVTAAGTEPQSEKKKPAEAVTVQDGDETEVLIPEPDTQQENDAPAKPSLPDNGTDTDDGVIELPIIPIG